MSNNESCKHGAISPVSLLTSLHESQAGSGRHHCPICAYDQGFNLGSNNKWLSYQVFCDATTNNETCTDGSTAPTQILINLGENQGGTGRHKCTNCAFKAGFNAGLSKIINTTIDLELTVIPERILRPAPATEPTPSRIDYVERDANNRHLGFLGELFIFEYEKNFLNQNGRTDLAANVKHMSVEIGDGLGYDVLSFELDGSEKKIEVKTTRGNIERPFFITRNEVSFSVREPNASYLYRLFDFDLASNKAKYYVVKGDLSAALDLSALTYSAVPKSIEL